MARRTTLVQGNTRQAHRPRPRNTWFQTPLDQPPMLLSRRGTLLRPVDDEAGLGVGNEAAACKRGPVAVVHEREVAAGDVDPPHRGACETAQKLPEDRQPKAVTLIVRFERERQKLLRATQKPGCRTGCDIDVAVDRDVGRQRAEAGYAGVVAPPGR